MKHIIVLARMQARGRDSTESDHADKHGRVLIATAAGAGQMKASTPTTQLALRILACADCN